MRLTNINPPPVPTTPQSPPSENTKQQSMSHRVIKLARKQIAKRLEPLRLLGIEPHGFFARDRIAFQRIRDGKPVSNLRGSQIKLTNKYHNNFETFDLSHIDLSRRDLEGIKLIDEYTDPIDYEHPASFDFSHANLNSTNLSGAQIDRPNFFNADLTNANLSNAHLKHAMIGPQTNFTNVNLSNSTFKVYLDSIDEYFIDFTNANFSKITVSTNINDFRIKLEGATFTPYKLYTLYHNYSENRYREEIEDNQTRFLFDPKKIHNKSLKKVTINSLDLSSNNFNGFNFSGATLQNIKMVGTNFNNTTFDNATITLDFSDLTSFDGLDISLNHINNPYGTLLTAIDSIPNKYNKLKINLMRQVIAFLKTRYNKSNSNEYNQLCSHYPAIIQIIAKPPYSQDPLIQKYISTKIMPQLIEQLNSSRLNSAQFNNLFEYVVPYFCAQLNQKGVTYFKKNNGAINQLLMALKQTISAMTIQLQWHHHHQRPNPLASTNQVTKTIIKSGLIKNKVLLHQLITALANAIPPNVHQTICDCAVMDDTIVDLLCNNNTALFPITWNHPDELAFVLICPNAICRMLDQTATVDDFKNIIVVCKPNNDNSNFDYMPPDILKTNLTRIYKQIPLLNRAFQSFKSSFMFTEFIQLLGFSKSITQLFIDASKAFSLPNEQKLFGSSTTNGQRMQDDSGKQIEAEITNALKSKLSDNCNGNVAGELHFIDTPLQSLRPDAFDPPLTTEQIDSAKNNLRGIQISADHCHKILDCCQAVDTTQNEKAIILLCIATVMSKYSSSLLFGTDTASPQALRNYTLAIINAAIHIDSTIISEATHQQWQSVLLGEAFSCTAILTNDMKTTLIHDNQHKAIAEKWFNQLYPMAW